MVTGCGVSVSSQTLVQPAAAEHRPASHVTMERNTAQYNLKTNNNSNSKVASLDVDGDLGKRWISKCGLLSRELLPYILWWLKHPEQRRFCEHNEIRSCVWHRGLYLILHSFCPLFQEFYLLKASCHFTFWARKFLLNNKIQQYLLRLNFLFSTLNATSEWTIINKRDPFLAVENKIDESNTK